MKNHIKGFGQFINERAQGDYFGSSSLPHRYGLHGGGSADWKGSSDDMGEPDEDLEGEEFTSKYGSEVFPQEPERFGREMSRAGLKQGDRVQVWKGRHEAGASSHDKIRSMSTEGLEAAIAKLSRMTPEHPGLRSKIEQAIATGRAELARRQR